MVGGLGFKARPGSVLRALLRIQSAVTAQDLGNRAGRWHALHAQVPQAPTDLAAAPAMLVAQSQHFLLHGRRRLLRAGPRPAGDVLQPNQASLQESLQPFVGSFPADSELPAQLALVDTLFKGPLNDLPAQRHGRGFPPRHGPTPSRDHDPLRKLLPMSPVTYVPGPYIQQASVRGAAAGGGERFSRRRGAVGHPPPRVPPPPLRA